MLTLVVSWIIFGAAFLGVAAIAANTAMVLMSRHVRRMHDIVIEECAVRAEQELDGDHNANLRAMQIAQLLRSMKSQQQETPICAS